MARLIFLASFLLVFGCTSSDYVHHSKLTPDQILERTVVDRTELRKTTFITSASFQSDPKTTGYLCMMQFEADITDEHPPQYYLTIYTERPSKMGFARLDKAVDSDGNAFLLKKEKEALMDKRYCELVSAQLTRDYLNTLLSGDKYWKLQNGATELEIPMPANILQTFLHMADTQYQISQEKAVSREKASKTRPAQK